MITDVISEYEAKRLLALWMLKNDKGTNLPLNTSKDEFADEYKMPDLIFRHTQSTADKDGNINTLLKAEIHLDSWETRKGSEEMKFTLYKVLQTSGSNPDTEPYIMGYIAVY